VRELLDELPVQQLKPGRYTFRAVLAAADGKLDQKKEAKAPFLVDDPAPAKGRSLTSLASRGQIPG
jgi:hypothetical protein